MKDERTKVKVLAILIGLAFISVLVVAIVFYTINSKKTATISTKIVPLSASVTINHKKYQPNQSYHFEPGNYTILITASNYDSQEISFALADNETKTLPIALTPTSGSLSDYCTSYNKECQIFEEIMQLQSSQNAKEYFTEYPVAKILPLIVVDVDPVTYDWTEYRIDGGKFDNCKTEYCIKITDSTGGNRDKALQKIKEKGYNPNDYEIIYDYTPVEPLE